jgi:hypothetical protein
MRNPFRRLNFIRVPEVTQLVLTKERKYRVVVRASVVRHSSCKLTEVFALRAKSVRSAATVANGWPIGGACIVKIGTFWREIAARGDRTFAIVIEHHDERP